MRLLTWNLNIGKAGAYWSRLQNQLGADFVFLQESRPLSEARNELWQEVPGQVWGSAISCASGWIEQVHVPRFEGWVVGGRYTNECEPPRTAPLYLFSLHAPTNSDADRRDPYVAEVVSAVDAVLAAVADGARIVIAGDFNFLSFGERSGGESLMTTKKEREALAHFAKHGLVPLWRTVHPEGALPQTLRWSGDAHAQFHCDGFLVSRDLSNDAHCEVLTSARLMAVSDHNPVAAWL